VSTVGDVTAGPVSTKRRIFALDDAPADLLVLERALRRLDPELTLVAFGVADDLFGALDALRDAPWNELPAYLLLDVNLGADNGLVLMRRLRADYPGLPVIVLSGSARPEDRDAAYRGGAAGFITKPLGIDALTTRLETIDRYWQETMATCARLDP